MLSKDGLVEVLVGKDMGQVIFPPLAWSVVNVPTDASETAKLFKNLYNSPTSQHITLAVHRQRKKDKVFSFANLGKLSNDWKYLDTVTILYEKPSSSSNNGFLPVSEPANMFIKGDIPDTDTTAWFNEDVGNATNLWDVGPVDGVDAKEDKTYYQKFSVETNLILMSMCRPLETRRFAYLCDVDKNEVKRIYAFCKAFNLIVCLFAETDSEAKKLIEIVNS